MTCHPRHVFSKSGATGSYFKKRPRKNIYFDFDTEYFNPKLLGSTIVIIIYIYIYDLYNYTPNQNLLHRNNRAVMSVVTVLLYC